MGTELTQAEWESITAHVLDAQVTGDTIYASSATQLRRLAIGATDTLLSVVAGIPAWVSEINNITLDTSVAKGTWTASGTWTIPAVTLGGAVTAGGNNITGLGDLTFGLTGKGLYAATADGATVLFVARNAATETQTVAQITGNATVANSRFEIQKAGSIIPTLTTTYDLGDGSHLFGSAFIGYVYVGSALLAVSGNYLNIYNAQKVVASAGVVGYSVVPTTFTLGSLGTIVIPQSAANVTDALAGNIAGCIALDLTNAAERLYFRGGAGWFYIAKTGGLSLTKEERIDPTGYNFQVGDAVTLVVDRINADGSFHAAPYWQKGKR